ncbi:MULTISPECIES: carbohydrate ABC transporter permease [Anaerolinea]|uniref:carbohydrate ABC transporter permease n=1 Tax=Anaerolinea TaxID=233189 RepID=UPI002601C3BA|nr:sugar ABC transporter permease [Anaerolinea thermophila]
MMKNPYLDTLMTAGLTVVFIVLTSYGLAVLARQIQRWRGASPKVQQDTFAGYLFAAPWITGFLIFVVFPLLASLYWSFTDFRIASGASPQWVGFSNYARLLLKDTSFRASIVNTLFLVVVGLPLQIAVALFLAVILNQKARGEKIFRMAFYLPVILGFNAAVLLCWRLMLNTGTGIINQILRALSRAFPPFDYLLRAGIFIQELISAVFLGIGSGKFNLLMKIWEAGFPPPNRVPLWIQSPLWSKTSVILLMIWGCGAMMMIFLAGLNNIPKELHEAAEVDGANRFQRFWKITFPLLTPYIFYNLVVGTINTLQIFEPIYVLYRDNQPLVSSAISMVYYLWQVSFRHFEIGMGSAISWLIMLLILIVTLIQFRLQNRWVTYELY